MVRTGRCLCGHVRYEVEGELPPTVNCHCQFCRRAHGAPFTTVAWLPSTQFRFTSGEDELLRYAQGGGVRSFCGHCGTRLVNGLVSGADFVSLIVATLDEEPEHGPTMHINLESKSRWIEIRDELPQHASLPPEVVRAIEAMERD